MNPLEFKCVSVERQIIASSIRIRANLLRLLNFNSFQNYLKWWRTPALQTCGLIAFLVCSMAAAAMTCSCVMSTGDVRVQACCVPTGTRVKKNWTKHRVGQQLFMKYLTGNALSTAPPLQSIFQSLVITYNAQSPWSRRIGKLSNLHPFILYFFYYHIIVT